MRAARPAPLQPCRRPGAAARRSVGPATSCCRASTPCQAFSTCLTLTCPRCRRRRNALLAAAPLARAVRAALRPASGHGSGPVAGPPARQPIVSSMRRHTPHCLAPTRPGAASVGAAQSARRREASFRRTSRRLRATVEVRATRPWSGRVEGRRARATVPVVKPAPTASLRVLKGVATQTGQGQRRCSCATSRLDKQTGPQRAVVLRAGGGAFWACRRGFNKPGQRRRLVKLPHERALGARRRRLPPEVRGRRHTSLPKEGRCNETRPLACVWSPGRSARAGCGGLMGG